VTTPSSYILRQDWDADLIKLGGHLYQSTAWAKFQIAQGRQILAASGETWSWLAALRHGRGGITYLYSAYGPTIHGASANTAVSSLVDAGHSVNADFIRFEPLGVVESSQLQKLGARQVGDMQPRYRLQLDITPDEANLRHAISPSNRNLINTAEHRGLSFHISSDPSRLPEHLLMQQETARRGGFQPHNPSYYQQLVDTLMPLEVAHFYAAERDGRPVASAICVDFDKTRYYLEAATHPDENRLHKGAIALLWWMILDAKSKGLATFDYGGVAPDDQPNHPWAGHTRFKKSVGGALVASSGTWELPLKPTKYALYRLARKVLPV
jgi:lipid II:glycine glycyltransferase (peptidoglycan interpeptide bridge formation enzyme)